MNDFIEIGDDIKRTFPMVDEITWYITYTTRGVPVVLFDALKVGNPDDKCWNLILESGLPVYLAGGGERDPKRKFWQIKNPKDLVWAYDDDGRIGIVQFEVDESVIRRFRGVAILMFNWTNAPDEIEILEARSVNKDDGIEMIVNQVCENLGRVPEEFVKALVDYYKNRGVKHE